ncbi:MAG: branched-chain amino acid ABC transporter substrate-binding protein [Caldilineaceae bacterium]
MTSIVLLFALIITACGGGSSSQPTKGDVIVYVAVPLSGFQANGGQTVLGGVRLAAEETNRNGGLLGYRVVVRPLDDESDSDTALANVDEIRSAINSGERVLGVIGHLNSGQTDATLGEYDSLGLITITPTASEESLTSRGYTKFFRVNANDSVQAKVDAQFLIEQMKAHNVAVVHNDTEYGKGLAASLATALGQLGGVEAMRVEVAEGESNYAPVLAKLQGSAVDALFYAGYEIEAPYLAAALSDAGIKLPILASDGAFLAATIDEANGAAEGMYVSAFAPSPENAANPQWIEAYQAVEYRNPDTYSVNGYVAMQVLAEGVKAADSLDADAIASSLRTNSIPTVLGEMRFDEKGDLANPQIWIYQVENSEFRQVE